jgi:competence protein ComEA
MNEITPERSPEQFSNGSGGYSGWWLSWGESFLWKCAVLGIGVLSIWWIGWPQPVSLLPHTMQTSSTVQTHESGSKASSPEEELVHSVPTTVKEVQEETGVRGTVLVDLNEGTPEELAHLPGIGAVLAGRIVAHRTSHGAFRRVEDLVLVPGIGAKRLQQLRPYVGVRAPTSRMNRGPYA